MSTFVLIQINFNLAAGSYVVPSASTQMKLMQGLKCWQRKPNGYGRRQTVILWNYVDTNTLTSNCQQRRSEESEVMNAYIFELLLVVELNCRQ